LAAVFSAGVGPAPVAAFEVDVGPVALRGAPEVAAGDAREAQLALDSDLVWEAARGPTRVGLSVGHRAIAAPAGAGVDLRQRGAVVGRLSGVALGPDRSVALDLSAGYDAGLDRPGGGELRSSARLRAGTLDGLALRADLGWRAGRQSDAGVWDHAGRARLGLTRALGRSGRLQVSEQLTLDAGGVGMRAGLSLAQGPHALQVSQQLVRGTAFAPVTSGVYSWRVGAIGLALSADYTPGTIAAPASFFAGLAVVLGGDLPVPGDLLDALE
jgi:hypothetical protein